MAQNIHLVKHLEHLEETQVFPFPVVAFIKVNDSDHGRFLAFRLAKNQELSHFLDEIILPIHETGPITALNFRFAIFHKLQDSKNLNMKSNPNYLISYSKKRGFFAADYAKLTNQS